MRKVLWIIVVAIMLAGGCAAVRDMFLPSTDNYGDSRRFWDQTSDNPYR